MGRSYKYRVHLTSLFIFSTEVMIETKSTTFPTWNVYYQLKTLIEILFHYGKLHD